MSYDLKFSRSLIRWYKKHARDLPWRRTKDPYKIWISEIMLQQTTVKTVTPYYHSWIKRFPRLENVADASLEEILRLWQGLGYYSRVKNIHETARIISNHYNGIFPKDPDILKKLPGFGPYTVNAVLSFAFKKRYAIVDANVRRVMMRQLAINDSPETHHDKRIFSYLNQIIPKKSADIFNQALMELGALICRSSRPQCSLCPIKISCQAYNSGSQETIPKSKKYKTETIPAVVAVIIRNQKYLIQKRPPTGLLADLWEFPVSKIHEGESPFDALKRELKEALNVDIKDAKCFTQIQHTYTRYRVKLDVWFCQLDGFPKPNKNRRWIKLKDSHKFPMSAGSVKIVNRLLATSHKEKIHEYIIDK